MALYRLLTGRTKTVSTDPRLFWRLWLRGNPEVRAILLKEFGIEMVRTFRHLHDRGPTESLSGKHSERVAAHVPGFYDELEFMPPLKVRADAMLWVPAREPKPGGGAPSTDDGTVSLAERPEKR